MPSRLLLARPRGFCDGVRRAIEIVEMALASYGPPVYVRGEIVHNRTVIAELRAKGVEFVEDVECAPTGSLLILSAHGAPPDVWRRAEERGLKLIDATCPLVTKVHLEALRFLRQGLTVLMVGHVGHPEVEGVLGEGPGIQILGSIEEAKRVHVPDPDRVAVITQTTFSFDDVHAIIAELRCRFPRLITPALEDVCYATQNRQSAVKEIAKRADVLLVLGSANSSNSNRLVDVGMAAGIPSYLVEDVTQIREGWIQSANTVGLTAGASTPEQLVMEATKSIQLIGAVTLEDVEVAVETKVFTRPVIA